MPGCRAGALDDDGGHLAIGDVPDRLRHIDLVGDQRMVGAELGRKGQPFAILGESNHHDRLGARFHRAYDARESLGAGAEDDDALQELHLPFGPDPADAVSDDAGQVGRFRRHIRPDLVDLGAPGDKEVPAVSAEEMGRLAQESLVP